MKLLHFDDVRTPRDCFVVNLVLPSDPRGASRVRLLLVTDMDDVFSAGK